MPMFGLVLWGHRIPQQDPASLSQWGKWRYGRPGPHPWLFTSKKSPVYYRVVFSWDVKYYPIFGLSWPIANISMCTPKKHRSPEQFCNLGVQNTKRYWTTDRRRWVLGPTVTRLENNGRYLSTGRIEIADRMGELWLQPESKQPTMVIWEKNVCMWMNVCVCIDRWFNRITAGVTILEIILTPRVSGQEWYFVQLYTSNRVVSVQSCVCMYVTKIYTLVQSRNCWLHSVTHIEENVWFSHKVVPPGVAQREVSESLLPFILQQCQKPVCNRSCWGFP